MRCLDCSLETEVSYCLDTDDTILDGAAVINFLKPLAARPLMTMQGMSIAIH